MKAEKSVLGAHFPRVLVLLLGQLFGLSMRKLAPTIWISWKSVQNRHLYSEFLYIHGVPNWYLHFQMVITHEQKILQFGLIHPKKAKSMMTFYGIQI